MAYTLDELKTAVQTSDTFAEVMRKLGYKVRGGGPYKQMRRDVTNHNLDITHFKGKGHGTSKTAKWTMDEILVEGSKYLNLRSLKRRLINEGLMTYECKECGISEWNGKKLTLQLDHINGVNDDHRIDNLRLLCPNCHSQTPTFGGGNNKGK